MNGRADGEETNGAKGEAVSIPPEPHPRPGITESRSIGHAPVTGPHLAEVIEADTLHFEAECSRLYGAPAFGSFVRVEASSVTAGSGEQADSRWPTAVFGVVSRIATAATDPGRRTQALHLPPERLAERMPQLQLVLRTCFTAIVVGYEEDGDIRPYLPPRPPEIHRFVYACTPPEVEQLTREPDFLRVLAAAPEAPVEDVLAAAILSAATVRGSGAPAQAFIIQCGKAAASLFRREPDRFQSIMRRLHAAQRCAAGALWVQPLMG
jgi:hypothetical protein